MEAVHVLGAGRSFPDYSGSQTILGAGTWSWADLHGIGSPVQGARDSSSWGSRLSDGGLFAPSLSAVSSNPFCDGVILSGAKRIPAAVELLKYSTDAGLEEILRSHGSTLGMTSLLCPQINFLNVHPGQHFGAPTRLDRGEEILQKPSRMRTFLHTVSVFFLQSVATEPPLLQEIYINSCLRTATKFVMKLRDAYTPCASKCSNALASAVLPCVVALHRWSPLWAQPDPPVDPATLCGRGRSAEAICPWPGRTGHANRFYTDGTRKMTHTDSHSRWRTAWN